jgi:hypothetical protein
MTARTPLYVDDNNDLVEMSAGQIVEVQQRAIYHYGTSPSAVLTQVSGSGAGMAAMSDTRLQAGAVSQSATAFVAEGTTAEPGTVTVSYDKITLAYTASGSVGETSDTGTSFPVYYDNSSGSILAMSLTDFQDTFLHPAIDLMISGTESANTAGTYTITNSATAATNYTNVSDTAVFINTIANASAYTAGGIPETLDQPTTVTSYFLHRRDAAASTPSQMPVVIDSANNLQEMSNSTIDTLIGNWLRKTAAHSGDGYKVTYASATSGGNTRGTAMIDTKLNGSGSYLTRQVSDDYRSQEMPNGSAATITTYNLRINKG